MDSALVVLCADGATNTIKILELGHLDCHICVTLTAVSELLSHRRLSLQKSMVMVLLKLSPLSETFSHEGSPPIKSWLYQVKNPLYLNMHLLSHDALVLDSAPPADWTAPPDYAISNSRIIFHLQPKAISTAHRKPSAFPGHHGAVEHISSKVDDIFGNG